MSIDHAHTDFADADRGFIGTREDSVIAQAGGRTVWDLEAYAFLEDPCPPTAHPSLWRQGQLVARHGLYEVTPGIYQVRGFDLSNMTLVEGDAGVIVIDPLISEETAAAALALYRDHRGQRPVTGVIYTHAHVDHFGGVLGIYEGEGPVVAPDGFMESAVSENVYVGIAMGRRASYMYGNLLEKGPEGQVGCGLGMATSAGSIGLLAPTVSITESGQELVIDGVRIEFHLTPDTECPAEMNFYFPDHRALCLAENATRNMHNLVTLRGAQVRDARRWAAYLDEALQLFGERSDVAFASHHWPTWGQEAIAEYLSLQRDLYGYLHDQTLRMINIGMTGPEIAEELELPPTLEAAWHTHGYYGSTSHNVKAVYQRYLGWFSGNPADLWTHPPVARAERYLRAIGGVTATVEAARQFVAEGDYRFAAELLNHVVMAEPDREEPRLALAEVYDHLGHGAENATWRNFYLTGALELRNGVSSQGEPTPSIHLLLALTPDQIFDAMAIRLDGPRAWDATLRLGFFFTDLAEEHLVTLANGVLSHRRVESPGPVDVHLRLTKGQLLALVGGFGRDGVEITGDEAVLDQLRSYVVAPERNFPIVTP